MHGWFEENEDEIGDMAKYFSIEGVVKRNTAVHEAYATMNKRSLLGHRKKIIDRFMVTDNMFH